MQTPIRPRLLFQLLVVSLATVTQAASSPRSPNLLVIQTDEHSFRTIGSYRALLSPEQAYVWGEGVKVETPNLDWLAQHGALADRAYATTPICTPSRASLMTGYYPQNTGAIQNNALLNDGMITFAEVLRRSGYATGYAGKWHLDGDPRPGWQPSRKFGWDDNRYMFNRGHWKNLVEDEQGPRVGASDKNGRPSMALAGADSKSFTTDFLTDRTIDFIRQHKDGPFCYFVSIPDPHDPDTVRPPYDTMYQHFKFQEPVSAQSPGHNLPDYAATLPHDFNPAQMAQYFGMVKCIDDNVGRILDALRETGMLEQTFIVFTSDHGEMGGEHGRENKVVPLESSARIPFLLYAPGVAKPGTVVREAFGTVDFKPTILSLMGIPDLTRDEGRDASWLFRGGPRPSDWNDTTFVRIGDGLNPVLSEKNDYKQSGGFGWIGAFTRQYKFVVATLSGPCLFDLENDPDELTNLVTSPAHREIIRRLAHDLGNYARLNRDPVYFNSTRVQDTLVWAVSDQAELPAYLGR